MPDNNYVWIKNIYSGYEMEIKYECPYCHKEFNFISNFCPDCGKNMRNNI